MSQPDDYWWCYKHNLDARTPEDHWKHEDPCTHYPHPRTKDIAEEIVQEYLKARRQHAPMNSGHEGYAVILEELDELWEHVRGNTARSPEARKEAIQIAAMALAFAVEVCGE